MKCRNPITLSKNTNGDHVWDSFPCGQCLNCRITKRQSWTLRILLEMRKHEFNYFLTLTYSNDYIPEGGNLEKADLQKFWKRLRKRFGHKIRFFAVGEYGDQTLRPHYHAVIFTDHEIPVERRHRPGSSVHYWHSDLVEDSWLDGCRTDCTPIPGESDGVKIARYVAGYVLKKIKDDRSKKLKPKMVGGYWRIFNLRGWRLEKLAPQFSTMSTKPGIGHDGLMGMAKKADKANVGPWYLDRELTRTADIHMVRYNGKKWPLDRYMRGKMIGYLGEDIRTDRNKAIARHTLELGRTLDAEKAAKDQIEREEAGHKAEKLFRNARTTI